MGDLGLCEQADRGKPGDEQGEHDEDGERSRKTGAADQGDQRLEGVREQDTEQHRRDESRALPQDVERAGGGHDRHSRGTGIDPAHRGFGRRHLDRIGHLVQSGRKENARVDDGQGSERVSAHGELVEP